MDEQVDAKWIRLMTYYAQKHEMGAIVPFFTGKFVYYGNDQKEFISAINSGKRTEAFYGYRDVIEKVKAEF